MRRPSANRASTRSPSSPRERSTQDDWDAFAASLDYVPLTAGAAALARPVLQAERHVRRWSRAGCTT